jgi:hypothetical protein
VYVWLQLCRFVAFILLPAARCPLPAACCLLPAACCLLPAARCCPLLPAACCLLPAACCLLPAACWLIVYVQVPIINFVDGAAVCGYGGKSHPDWYTGNHRADYEPLVQSGKGLWWYASTQLPPLA